MTLASLHMNDSTSLDKTGDHQQMNIFPACPKCSSEYTYEDSLFFICPECAHEWPKIPDTVDSHEAVVKDSNGVILTDGDDITVIKDLKVKGTSSVIKVGTKVKGIRLVEGDHNIDCKVPGIGAMQLKSEFVKKIL